MRGEGGEQEEGRDEREMGRRDGIREDEGREAEEAGEGSAT
jgi:hypothetical protein